MEIYRRFIRPIVSSIVLAGLIIGTSTVAYAQEEDIEISFLPAILCILLCEDIPDDTVLPDLKDILVDKNLPIGVAISTFQFSNNGGTVISDCEANPDLPPGLTTQPTANQRSCEISGTPTSIQPATQFTISATNLTGTGSATITLSTGELPELIDEAGNNSFVVGLPIVAVVFTNNGGSNLTTCNIEPALATGLSVALSGDNNTCVISGTPTQTQNLNNHVVTAQNIYGEDTASINIRVDQLPELANQSATQNYATNMAIVPLSFDNTGGGGLSSCEVAPSLPTGLTIAVSMEGDTCVISGAPTINSAAQSYTVTATNIAGNDDATITITTGPAPALENIVGSQIFPISSSITDIVFSNIGGGNLSSCISTPALPDGLVVQASMSNTTCEISGLPTAAQAATNYTINATNLFGSNSGSVSIQILTAPNIEDETNSQSYPRNFAIETYIFNNLGGTELTTCSVLPALPTGLSVGVAADNTSCEISGTPTSLSPLTSYSVTASNIAGDDSANIDLRVIDGFQVAGTVTFDRVPTRTFPTRLDYNNIIELPVREATVQLLDNSNNVLETTRTDIDGSYSFVITNDQLVRVRVRAELLKETGNDRYDVQVIDNTNSGALYTLAEGTSSLASGNGLRDLRAASGWGGSSYTSTRASAPFAMLDSIYEAMSDFIAIDPNIQFPQLRVNWSVNNTTAGGNLETGAIGTSFYSAGRIFILGAENNDTDEFDGHIVIHEWGHFFEDTLSRSDSIGGSHGGGDRLDMRVAFGEGYGNALSGIITDDPFYVDTSGSAQNSGFFINVDNNSVINPGWYSEGSVQSILYDLYDSNNDGNDTISLGLDPIYQILINQQKDTSVFTSIFTFIEAMKDEHPGDVAAIDQLVNGQSINSTSINEKGSNETNNAGTANVLPVYTNIVVDGGAVNVCSITNFNRGGDRNKLSNHRFLTFTIPAIDSYTLQATRTSSTYGTTDPDFVVFLDGVFRINADSALADQETATRNLGVGTYVMDFHDFNVGANTGNNTACFNITVSSN